MDKQKSMQIKNKNKFIDTYNTKAIIKYLKNAELKFIHADNFGLSLDDAGEIGKGKSFFLRDLFVPPHLSERHLAPEQVINAENHSEPIWQNIVSILKNHPKCFILGDPGTGKTTLTHWLMLAFTYSSVNSTKVALGELVPFALILRELPLHNIKSFDDLWRVFIESNQDVMSAFSDYPESYDVINTLFSSGQALFLLDGLDEITNEQTRQNLGIAVREGMQNYPNCKFLISSRVVGFDQFQWFGFNSNENDLQKKIEINNVEKDTKDVLPFTISDPAIASLNRDKNVQFPIFYLAPFTYTQAQKFVSNWYKLYQSNNDGNLDQRVGELLSRMKRNDGLGRLSRTPVLLNMICFIHARRGRLPDGRAELYQRIEETYLVALDTARGITAGGEHQFNFDYADRSDWLSEIAYIMQSNRSPYEKQSTILISENNVREILHDKLVALEVPSEDLECEIDFLLKQFAERSGLFLPRGKNRNNEERYGFSHLSFLEYFAAKALKPKLDLKEISWQFLSLKTNLIWWQETFVLFFEQLENAKLADLYISKLFPINIFDKKTKLAAQTLLASIVMDSGVKLTKLKREIVIKQLWDSHKLMSLRDPYLPNDLIQRLWRTEYRSLELGQDALKSLTNLNLSMTDIDDFSTLYELKQLTQLCLDFTEISELSGLIKITGLQVLSLDQTQITDVSLLSNLTNLSLLSLESNQINDISALKNLTNLTQLYLGNTIVDDISQLGELTQLLKFHIDSTHVTDLSILVKLTRLNQFVFSETAVNDLSPLSKLQKLKYLIFNNTKVKDLAPLSKVISLNAISMSDNEISDLTPLKGLTKLHTLVLDGTAVDDLLPLTNLSRLSYLKLDNTKVKDLNPLSHLKTLTTLSLNNTKVTDISALTGLTELRILSLENTEIQDISIISKLVNLQTLNLSNTNVIDITSLANLTKLKQLNIKNTQVTDTSILDNLNNLIVIKNKISLNNK